jgi:hypothetical protein
MIFVKERSLTIQAILHSLSHRDNFLITMVALVVFVAQSANLSLCVCEDNFVEMVYGVSLSCRLRLQVKLA